MPKMVNFADPRGGKFFKPAAAGGGGGGGGGSSIEATASYATGTDDGTFGLSTHPVTLPTSIASGDLLVVTMRVFGGDTSITTPAGWTSLLFLGFPDDSNITLRCMYRVADGSEGSSVPVSIGATRHAAATAYRISGVATGEASFIEIATNGDRTALSLSPSWGSAANAWLTVASTRGVDNTLTEPPDFGGFLQGFTDPFISSTSDTRNGRLASAHQNLESSSIAFSLGDAWSSTGTLNGVEYQLIAVRPA